MVGVVLSVGIDEGVIKSLPHQLLLHTKAQCDTHKIAIGIVGILRLLAVSETILPLCLGALAGQDGLTSLGCLI
jgi:hypothetical protein